MKPVRILIDTNILINLEQNKVIDEHVAKLYQLATSNKCDVYYHPACLLDFKRDKDHERQKINLSKLQKYAQMPDPGLPTDEFIKSIGIPKKENDEVDNAQLFQLHKGYIDYFITEDKEIKVKASKINLKSKVLSVLDAFKILNEKFTLVIPQHPLLQECSTRELESELNDSFFDSLREGYDGFNKWFNTCVKKNRRCYLLRIDGRISAILIYNRESKSEHELPNLEGDALKMCTFKVAETVFGYRLGELFLNKMIELCIKANIKYLYLTVYPEHIQLIDLLSKYGFKKIEFTNKDNKTELRLIKSLIKHEYSESPQAISSHPFYFDDVRFNKFVIPIEPNYYKRLFKDGVFRDRTLFDNSEDSLNETSGNTISKAYLCKSKRLSMKCGDLLFFYGSQTIKCIEPIGILDSVTYTKDLNEIKYLVNRKTVYSDSDLQKMVEGERDVTVIIFRLINYLKTPITFKRIRKLESFSNKFQTITTLTESDYISLKNNNYFDERFIIN